MKQYKIKIEAKKVLISCVPLTADSIPHIDVKFSPTVD
jgi:hypothetical protein